MKRIFVAALLVSFIFNLSSRADEGLWLLSRLLKNYDKMKEMGLQLTPEDIYSVNNACLKDAIAGLASGQMAPQGFYCTGEMISAEGLMLTNHHCAYDNIQKHSTIDHDYLADGFWAQTKNEELTCDGMTASFLVRMEDVTDQVFADITDDMPDSDKSAVIDKATRKLQKEAGKDNHYDVIVKSMYGGNQYFLFVYETFKDIRLVGAPPSSIGKFGGDTDNWMWPRHTGDFSLYRVYCAPDGTPAEYSQDNVPYKPKHFLPISIKGVKEGDFAMVFGFPGTTQRFMTSYGIEETIEVSNPIRIKIRTRKLDIIKEAMDESREKAAKTDDPAKKPKVHIQYASKYAQSSNYWKYSIGQNKGLKRLKVYDQRKALEDKFDEWVNADPERKKKYGDALNLIEQSYKNNENANYAFQYLFESLFQGGEVIMFALQSGYGLYNTLKNTPDNEAAINETVRSVRESAEDFFKDYNVDLDKKVFAAMMEIYYKDVPKEYHIDVFSLLEKKYKGDIDKFTEALYEKSVFTDQARLDAFLSKPSVKALEKDLGFMTMQSVLQMYFQLNGIISGNDADRETGKKMFIAGLMEMEKDRVFYPNANSTIRMTYGSVGDYLPMDAVHYDFYTTLKGVMEKEDPTVDEFIVPDKLKDLFHNKDFGRYGENNEMRVCFTTNNDITGGNSGSPVINGNGELIGTAFDGNWEAMSGDIEFEDELQKCINVDIRYVLFVIDKYAGAHHLIEEMKIVE